MRRLTFAFVTLVIASAPDAWAEEVEGPEKPDEPLTAPVQINSTNGALDVKLWRLGDSHDVIRCTTPCALDLPLGRYHLHAGGRPSRYREYGDTIEVGPNGYRTTLRSATRAGYNWGVALTSFGTAAVLYYGIAVLGQFLAYPNDSYNQAWFAINSALFTGIAGGSLAGGLYLLHQHGKGPVE